MKNSVHFSLSLSLALKTRGRPAVFLVSLYIFNVYVCAHLKGSGLSWYVLPRGKELAPQGVQKGGLYFTANQFISAEGTSHCHHSNNNTEPGCCRGWMGDVYKLLCYIYLSVIARLLCFFSFFFILLSPRFIQSFTSYLLSFTVLTLSVSRPDISR